MAKDSDEQLSLAQASRVLSLPVERFAPSEGDVVLIPVSSPGERIAYRRSDVERLATCCHAGTHHHAVQFFEHDDFLCEAVTRYLGEGFDVDAPMVVIARPDRLRAFTDALRTQGRPVDQALASGQLCLFDAHQTLAKFMRGGSPQAGDFRAVIGPVIERSRAGFPHARLRAYGEMVDILWERGQPDAAIRLESLWNELASTLPFSLLCGYRMSNFGSEADTERFARVCSAHSDVSPTESCTHPGKLDAHRREVARLQQRIHALEAVARRTSAAPLPVHDSPSSAERSSLPDSLSILVVDDDPGARRLVLETLSEIAQPRLHVREAASVTSALACLKRDPVDLCVCDFRLGAGETALDLFRAARSGGCYAPFIGITGNLLEEDLAETLLSAGLTTWCSSANSTRSTSTACCAMPRCAATARDGSWTSAHATR